MDNKRNTGNCNTGYLNTGNCNTGYCNTITPQKCLIFNKEANREDWKNAKKPNWMFVDLAKWIDEKDMTDKEKKAYPTYITTGGYLKFYASLKEAFIESWENTTDEDKELTLKLPNFDDKIFLVFGY